MLHACCTPDLGSPRVGMNRRGGLVFGISGLAVLALLASAAISPVAGRGGSLPPTSSSLSARKPQPPGRFAVRSTTARLGGQPGLAWDTLHPAHQRLISRAHFIRCERQVHGSAWRLRRVDFASERALRIHRRGVSQTRGTQVWMEVRATSGGPPFADPVYVDVVRVGSKLRWLLDRSTEMQLRRNPADCWG